MRRPMPPSGCSCRESGTLSARPRMATSARQTADLDWIAGPMLRSLLVHADDDPQTAALARDGGRAFVSQSLRPYLLAALLERNRDHPAIVVAGDDRAARDLAAALKTWLEPRRVRYYPSRGVSYESHLVPPAHLVGLRIAALDSLLEAGDE